MTRRVTFADGFTSASIPELEGTSQESFTLANNLSVATNITGLVFDSLLTKSVFGTFEVMRSDSGASYRQMVDFKAVYNGSAWSLSFGLGEGDQLIQDTITITQDVVFSITAAGQVQALTGNMAGTGYAGTLKVISTRILI